jgi:predicted  nucleic acid-binding Zn-ribbon protein
MAMERQGLGVPYAKKPTGGSTPEEEQQMEEALQNLRANEKGFVMFREGWEIGFLDMKSGTIKNPTQMIQHHDRQISKNVLAQFLELGSGNGGSWALSQDQSKLFLLSLEAVANYIADNINKFVIKKLVDFNFPNVENYPKLCFDKIGNVNFSALMVALQQGIQSKIITPDAKLEEYLRDVMDLPEYSGETLVDPAMADTMINELEMSLSDATGENAPTGAEEETPEEDATEPTDAEVQEAYDQIQVWGKTNHVSSIKKAYGDELAEYFKAGVVGQPLSEETKRKISEALKKIRGGGSGSKKKGTNPEVAKRNKEIAGLRKQVKEFSDAARRELLDMRAKGIKLSPEDAAKKQLELFDKRKPIMDKIEKLKDEVSAIKEKSAATPAPAKKAHDHTAEPTDPSLLKMSEDLSHAIKKLTK